MLMTYFNPMLRPMATSLAQLTRQIAKLEKQARAIKEKDARGVIARIKEAIATYDLTSEDLGFGRGASAKKSKPISAAKGTTKSTTPGKYKTGIKFRDEQGNAWSGHGRRPQWYVDAIASGKTPDQLAR